MKKIAAVTGGAGGIGSELCKRLVFDGFQVVAGDLNVSESENGAPDHLDGLEQFFDSLASGNFRVFMAEASLMEGSNRSVRLARR